MTRPKPAEKEFHMPLMEVPAMPESTSPMAGELSAQALYDK